MSKSRGNVINPDDIVGEFGADTLRLYIMFIGDFEKAAPWSQKAVKGCKRFLDRVWNISERTLEGDELSDANEMAVHRAIKKVGSDIENLKFNTAIATLMALVNDYYDKPPSRGDVKTLLTLLSPFAPHIADELWERQGFGGRASAQLWPEYDEEKTIDQECEIAVQIGGKLRSTVKVPLGSDDEFVLKAAVSNERIAQLIDGKEIVRTIIVKNKLINLIVK
jgi:leucyl-tRNA synthetase